MIDVPEDSPDYEQACYNRSQVLLIQYMIRKGVIKTPEEFGERFASVFADLAQGKVLGKLEDALETVEQTIEVIKGALKKEVEGI